MTVLLRGQVQQLAIHLDRLGTVAEVLALAPPMGDPIGVLV